MNTLWIVLAVVFALAIAYVLYVVLRIVFDPEVRQSFQKTITTIKRAWHEASERIKEENQKDKD